MFRVFRDRASRSWLFLVLATSATFWLSVDGLAGPALGAGTLGIAYLKGRLIILDFMDLRRAPLLYRGLVEGWLLLVSITLFTAFALGTG
ncbi:hypothetical protein D3874_22565 [Oleomonas cavernae]|uniref:Cytochrome C oxidase subunit IV n=1 Tax=Oleomonas cavernae TaxID=2320859 RepID=A0A418WH92_9PROT|nr:cytochrome C oxidase subunit IV family protein [Oleomonas cavernae]RJF89411.1 hypothetical protein D3874_22565 [Oleomonas cavernae]